jgi:iron complex transport system substrate-binding protein
MGGIRMRLTHRFTLVLLLALAACTPRAPGTGPLVVVDDAGDTLRLDAPATRVVSLIPATTELFFAIGAGPELVGRTRWCDWPAAAAAVTDVGDGIEPNLEAIVAQRPDLVVLYLAGSNAEVAGRLRQLGIAVVQLRTDLLESVPRNAHLLGTLTGHAAGADSLVAAFEAELAAVTVSSHSGADTPKRQTVFIPTWDQPIITVGAGSFLDELVTRAGGVNVFHDLPQPSAPVSLESVFSRDPDLILTTAPDEPKLAKLPEWSSLRAVRQKKFVRVHGSQFDRPGPRSPQAIAELKAALLEAQR